MTKKKTNFCCKELSRVIKIVTDSLKIRQRTIKDELSAGSNTVSSIVHGKDIPVSHYIHFFRMVLEWKEYCIDTPALEKIILAMVKNGEDVVVEIVSHKNGAVIEKQTILHKKTGEELF